MKVTYLNHRFKDVIIALAISQDYERSLGKIQLQKYIYIIDTLSVIASVVAPKNGHETYKHGPWDRKIQNAADALAFRGFINIDRSLTGERFSYSLSSSGIELFQRIRKNTNFSKRVRLFELVGIEVNKRGWHKLKALVYSEPTYLGSKGSWGNKFEYDSLISNSSLRVLKDFDKMFSVPVGEENLVPIFFKLIE
ncbi:hypothetical protein SAMN05661096_00655 [Marivirga sericea]|uniref:Antitoxin SocA-like Panacea domain-containing protein n=1 Tax=Marivirga sericea TaxID=1028 RepID=A0A1X7II07_9BACT|nr:hypothetical protein [Marivirga sericea]SMG14196.1 hypothetical protein SAMN05661096_00655 [Marivirga sericea]